MLLNLGPSIKSMLWIFLVSYFFRKKRKDSNNLKTSFSMLEANKDNSKTTLESSSIKFTRVGEISTFSFNFKHIAIVECNASFNN